ncbi:MAG: hypothetical protein AB1505_27090 [Candidatus Latescibacterota bacterium]
MSENAPGHWLFVVRTEDRPGAAADIAVVFSGRGIQIESLIGAGDPLHPGQQGEGVISLTFQAFRSRQEMVRRVLQRLEVVRSVEAYDYERDPRLVKTATLRLTRWDEGVEESLRQAGVTFHRLDAQVLCLSGGPLEVDRAIRELAGSGVVTQVTYALLPPPVAPQAGSGEEAAGP